MKLSNSPDAVSVVSDTVYTDPFTPVGSTWIGAIIERTAGSGAVDVVVQAALTSGANSEGADEVQSITIDATGGTYTLTFDGQTTAAIAFDATAQDVEDALVALSNINLGEVSVSGVDGGPYLVSFIGALGAQDVAEMTSNAAGLTGGGSTATVATVTAGGVPIADWVDIDLSVTGHNTDAPVQLLDSNSVGHLFAAWPWYRFKVSSVGTATVRCILSGG